jgi:hypothetical protein
VARLPSAAPVRAIAKHGSRPNRRDALASRCTYFPGKSRWATAALAQDMIFRAVL